MSRHSYKILILAGISAIATVPRLALAATTTGCSRPLAGSVATPAPDLYSSNGVLNVTLNYTTSIDVDGRTLFCFVTPDSIESPTLHVNPGDTLNITLNNTLPANNDTAAREQVDLASNVCGESIMQSTSVNMHFHGTNTSPLCHSDNVTAAIVNPDHSFKYTLKFPANEPPGAYWYHPHIHGFANSAALGGATGAIIVDGIQNIQPAVAGLPARELVLRDQNVANNPPPFGNVPSWDITLNYVPIAYPALVPARLEVTPGIKEFWRVVNADADTTMDLSLNYDGVKQGLGIVSLDGVPLSSNDGTHTGHIQTVDHIVIPPAGRAEFIVTTPASTVQSATLQTAKIDTGPAGDNDPARTLAVLAPSASGSDAFHLHRIPTSITPNPGRQLFEGIDNVPVSAKRNLYFSENVQGAARWGGNVSFFITVDEPGVVPTLYSPSNPPAIITHQGAVEEWTIENRATEIHDFHIHQIHFKVLAENGVPVPADQQQFRDTYIIPYWTGKGPYPSVTMLMDFRGAVVGNFVYHCHILDHEDNGMMAEIQVLPPGTN